MAYKILCIDELGSTRLELFAKLKEPGILVINARNRMEIQSALNNNYFSVLLCVINSESFRELEYISEIKQRVEYKEVPVIVISKFADRKYILKAVELGAQEYIAQPFDKEVLLAKILGVLGWKQSSVSGPQRPDEDMISFSFTEMFNKEIKAASRGGYPVSVILGSVVSRISLYKNDQELTELTVNLHKVIKTKVRDTDTVFFYGNGRLAILLPFADQSGVKVVEEKIKNVFETHSVLKPVSSEYRLITGAVSFPEDGKIQQNLLEKLKKSLDTNVKNELRSMSSV